MGLKTSTSELLNLALGGSFMHLFGGKATRILDQVIIDKLPIEPKENPLEEESQIAEPNKILVYFC